MTKTTKDAMILVAVRMQAAIKEGRISANHADDVTIDLGDGDRASIFNDAGSADYTQSICLGGTHLEYGDDFGRSGKEDYEKPETFTNPPDPLELIDAETFGVIDQFCRRAW